MLPRHIPLHEATEDDLRFFALAWQRRHSALPVWTGRRSRSHRQAIPQTLIQLLPINGRKRPHGILDFAFPCRPRKRHATRIRNPLPASTFLTPQLNVPFSTTRASGATADKSAAPLLLAMAVSPPAVAAISDALPAGSFNRNKRVRTLSSDTDSESRSDHESEDGLDTG